MAALIRTVTGVALGLGWLVSITGSPPSSVALSVGIVGAIMACMVGLRRCGTWYVKCWAAVWFYAGSVGLAAYSFMVACMIQLEVHAHPWDQFTESAVAFFVSIAALPLVSVTIVYMARAWIWSASDAETHDLV